jgi:hypothetical protein
VCEQGNKVLATTPLVMWQTNGQGSPNINHRFRRSSAVCFALTPINAQVGEQGIGQWHM